MNRHKVRSLHGYAGSPVSSVAPGGVEVSQDGEAWRLVETINAGRVLRRPTQADLPGRGGQRTAAG